ncbi:Putative DNA-binding domain-containing protein [Duganella sp. CF458]|uniref:HvfC/BufC N-terminal domain-containing protein n=1 Tax=Duganella sp. CF458 TaxID=1884368 RepID=UPI0008E03D38|nr:DNA-binding domain-containing protein [Duganella sp. CF458]SFF69329.1 Putative DNA-binding domain-containing protein [Duganella sp. CF458]
MNLADLQGDFRAMLAASAPVAGVPAGPGRAVYQNNYRAQLVGCLEESYPQLRTFIGEEAFLHAAATHIKRSPPHAWTLDAYADDFCDTLQALFPDNPDLHELAWIEHALSQAFIGPDAAPAAAEALAATDWEHARLTLTPTLQLRIATTNAADLWFALRDGSGNVEGEMLPAPGGLLVWRRGFVSCLRALDAIEFAALTQVQRDGSFAGLCALLVERVGEEQGIASAGAMLADWLGSELITGVENE